MIKININIWLFILLFSFSIKVRAQSKDGISFVEALSWHRIQEKAKVEHKLIFVDAYATWCVPCRKMDQDVYQQSIVGSLVNRKFISVKVQMDVTKNDEANVKAFYFDAKKIKQKYNVSILPTFLFFDENGLLIHQDVGYKTVDEFIKVINDAADPQKALINLINLYRKGTKDYPALVSLYFKVKEFKNKPLADSIAKDLKSNYFEKLTPQLLFGREDYLIYLGQNVKLYSSDDVLFKYCKQKLTDTSISMGKLSPLNAEFLLNSIIAKEEVTAKLSYGIQTEQNPKWDSIVIRIKKKYPFANAEKIVIYPKQDYYNKHQNWVEFAKAINELNIIAPPSLDGLDVFWRLNGTAWDMFEKTGDPFVLGEALKWVDVAIKLKPKPEDNLQFLDTRANVLYRLGRKTDAIEQEKKAILVAQAQSQTQLIEVLKATLKKMQTGLPTWPTPKSNPQ